MKILITGGSGFIGTNLVEHFLNKKYDILNVDINKPKVKKHNIIWKNVDIRNYKLLEKTVLAFNPDYIIHLAARTDLNGKKIEDYDSNTIGTENILNIIKKVKKLKKIIITSSKFVTKNGYKIKNQFDYCPHTVYGESKVITEQKVWQNQPNCDWCIIRPTSIWGPWFGEPYQNFFNLIMKKMYFHIGNTKCYKTYGYIGNSIYQIEQLLFNQTKDENNKIFYIGDEPAYEINEWADEIANEIGYKAPQIPIVFVKLLAKIGDFLSLFKIHFPMQSFRYNNMTNDGINNMNNTMEIAPNLPFTRKEGTKITIDWMKNHEKL